MKKLAIILLAVIVIQGCLPVSPPVEAGGETMTVTGVILGATKCLAGICWSAFTTYANGTWYTGTVRGWNLAEGQSVSVKGRWYSNGYVSGAKLVK